MTNLERYYPGLCADAFKPTEGSMAVDPVMKRTMPCVKCKAYGSCRKSRRVKQADKKYFVSIFWDNIALMPDELNKIIHLQELKKLKKMGVNKWYSK